MKVIDAVWEKRNLGVTCYEILLGMKDSFADIKREYKKISSRQYMVVKIPAFRYDLVHFFQGEGYVFSETSFLLRQDLNNLKIPKRFLNICKKCSWREMNREDLVQLSKEVSKNIFKTDRVYTDSYFTSKQAAQRYNFWINDLISGGTLPYKVMYEEEVVGFFMNRNIGGGTFDGLLAGVYSDYEGSGMGYCIQYAGLQSAIERGGNTYLGHVSGTNPEVLKILLSIGCVIKQIDYIFIKHNEGE